MVTRARATKTHDVFIEEISRLMVRLFPVFSYALQGWASPGLGPDIPVVLIPVSVPVPVIGKIPPSAARIAFLNKFVLL